MVLTVEMKARLRSGSLLRKQSDAVPIAVGDGGEFDSHAIARARVVDQRGTKADDAMPGGALHAGIEDSVSKE
jgi:hypothetical protein